MRITQQYSTNIPAHEQRLKLKCYPAYVRDL